MQKNIAALCNCDIMPYRMLFTMVLIKFKMLVSNTKKIFVTLILFLVVPIAVIAYNWQWQPDSLTSSDRYLFWLTETAGVPWAILTCLFFTLSFIFLLNVKSKRQMIKLILVLIIAMIVGQAIKSAIKTYTAESRPFVLWIEKQYSVKDEYFYSLPRAERKQIITEYVAQSSQIPNWLYQHWRNETGYTFPSGHTLFAATWAFLALLLLNFKRHYIFIGTSIAWVILIEISRLTLGMHRPIDLIVGAIIALPVALLSYYLAKRWRIIEK